MIEDLSNEITTPQEEPLAENAQVVETNRDEQAAIAADLALRERFISIAKDVTKRSLQISNSPDLKGLLALQAYQLHERNRGKYYDVDIYNGLYDALKELFSQSYNIYPSIRNSVKSVSWMQKSNSIISASNDGTIMISSGDYRTGKSQIQLTNTRFNNECMIVSPDESKAAVGTNGGGLLFLDLTSKGKPLHEDRDHGNIVLFLENIGNTGSFLSAGTENRILRWSFDNYDVTELVSLSARPSAVGTSPNGRKAAVGTRDGKLYEMDLNDPGNIKMISEYNQNHVRAIAYSPGGQNLVAGLLDGSIKVLAGSSRQTIATLRGPGARVSDLAYSPDGRFLVATSHDGKVYLWNTSEWKNPPIVFTDNNGFVLSVCFSRNGNYFYCGSADFPRLVGRPVESAQMAGDFCKLVQRNLTTAEWDQYFGGDLPFEETCPGSNN